MNMKQKLYVVTVAGKSPEGATVRLVSAANKQQAVAFVARGSIIAETATPYVLVNMTKAGVEIEYATGGDQLSLPELARSE